MIEVARADVENVRPVRGLGELVRKERGLAEQLQVVFVHGGVLGLGELDSSGLCQVCPLD